MLTIAQENRKFHKIPEGTVCGNCGAPAKELHHIVPLSLGGQDIPSNRIPLCEKCHKLIHMKTEISYSELIKTTFKIQRSTNTCTVGRPKATKPKDWDYVQELIKKGELSHTDGMFLLNMSRTTYYKYGEKWGLAQSRFQRNKTSYYNKPEKPINWKEIRNLIKTNKIGVMEGISRLHISQSIYYNYKDKWDEV